MEIDSKNKRKPKDTAKSPDYIHKLVNSSKLESFSTNLTNTWSLFAFRKKPTNAIHYFTNWTQSNDMFLIATTMDEPNLR